MREPPRTPAILLLSGGLDSACALAVARRDGFRVTALTVDYGQRHRVELNAARSVADSMGVTDHRVVSVDLRAIGGSALTADLPVPKDRSEPEIAGSIPTTYVPARNLIFLSLASALAETIGAWDLITGFNCVDYSGYPDCRWPFVNAFIDAANLASRAFAERRRPELGFRVHAPLINLTKPQIIRIGASLGVDFSLTTSCYDPAGAGLACGRCDSCQLRRRGFMEAGVPDPTRYA